MLALLFTQLQPQTATTVVRMLTPQRPRAMVLTDWAPTLGTGDDDDAVDVVSGDVVEQFLQRQREELKLRSKSGRDLLAAAREQDAKLQADGAGGAAPSVAAPAPASVAVLRRMASDTERAMERLEAAKEAARKRDEARYSRCTCVESPSSRRQHFSPPCAGTWTSTQATQRSGQCIVSVWGLTVLWHAPHPSTAHAALHQLAVVLSMVGL